MSPQRPDHTQSAELPELDLAEFDPFERGDSFDAFDDGGGFEDTSEGAELDDRALAAALDEVQVERVEFGARGPADHAVSEGADSHVPRRWGVRDVAVLISVAAALVLLVCFVIGAKQATIADLNVDPATTIADEAPVPSVEPDPGVVSGSATVPELPDLSNLPERPTPGATVGRN